MISLTDALDYELASCKLVARARYEWMREVLAWWFARKVKKKYMRYHVIKHLEALRRNFGQ